MTHSLVPLIVALGAAFGTTSLVHAEVLIGLSAPRTGTYAWVGMTAEEGVALAVADLNAKGGVLGEPLEMMMVDDYCAGDQAVAAAKKLVEVEVAVAIGPLCSGAAIPASKVFAEASVLMISPSATNPKLTEQGFQNIFRVIGRDDVQGEIAGDLLASRWGNKEIAILHDGQAYGKDLADAVRKRLNERGVSEAMFEYIQPRQLDYVEIVWKMQSLGIDVLYYAGYAPEAGLLLRSAREKLHDLRFVGGDGLAAEDFGLIASAESEGTLFTGVPDWRGSPKAVALATRIAHPGAKGAAIRTYAALQAWAQAVEMVGKFEMAAVAEALRSHEFDTVLGRTDFDEKGDVAGHYNTFAWYEWRGGKTHPVNPDKLFE